MLAVADNGVIGKDGGIPWHISDDMKRFKALTMGNTVVMGRKTWDSLPKKPLPGRVQYGGDAPDGLASRGRDSGAFPWPGDIGDIAAR